MKVDLHPDDLLERERRGLLREGEREHLDEHARQCKLCAFERRAESDFADLFEPFAGDGALVARLVETALDPPRAARTPLRSIAPRGGTRRLGRVALIAAAALASGIAAAAIYSVVKSPPPPRTSPAVEAVPPVPSELERPKLERSPSPPPSAEPKIDLELPPNPSVGPSAKAAPSAAPPADSGLGAAELFARGNKARRSGSYAAAVRDYGELQRRFPASREARTSQLALGWLLLNQLGNPRGALAQFDGYLAGGGVMSEEAGAGRALALGRLGRAAEERRAWEELLARYPSSVHAERARKRLEELK